MSDKDVLFMKRAFALALLGMGKVAPNPLVGCVIVKNGKIIDHDSPKELVKKHGRVNLEEVFLKLTREKNES